MVSVVYHCRERTQLEVRSSSNACKVGTVHGEWTGRKVSCASALVSRSIALKSSPGVIFPPFSQHFYCKMPDHNFMKITFSYSKRVTFAGGSCAWSGSPEKPIEIRRRCIRDSEMQPSKLSGTTQMNTALKGLLALGTSENWQHTGTVSALATNVPAKELHSGHRAVELHSVQAVEQRIEAAPSAATAPEPTRPRRRRWALSLWPARLRPNARTPGTRRALAEPTRK